MSSPAADPDACAADGRCITCGDEGIPMEVVSVSNDTATCRDGEAVVHEVMVDLVAPVTPGEAILVHAGTAIGRAEVVNGGVTSLPPAERLVTPAATATATGHQRGVL